MSGEDVGTWRDRKKAVREQYLKQLGSASEDAVPTTPATPGSAASPSAATAASSAMGDGPPSASTGTSATAMDPSATPSGPPPSSMPAESTNGISAKSMVWMVAPTGFVEASLKASTVEPNGSLVPGLAPWVRASLLKLATARAEPVEDVILQIAEWFVEEEDERAEGPLRDALEFYCLNYLGAA